MVSGVQLMYRVDISTFVWAEYACYSTELSFKVLET